MSHDTELGAGGPIRGGELPHRDATMMILLIFSHMDIVIPQDTQTTACTIVVRGTAHSGLPRAGLFEASSAGTGYERMTRFGGGWETLQCNSWPRLVIHQPFPGSLGSFQRLQKQFVVDRRYTMPL